MKLRSSGSRVHSRLAECPINLILGSLALLRGEIFLRHGDVGMAQPVLHGANVHTTTQRPRRKGVSEFMEFEFARFHSCPLSNAFADSEVRVANLAILPEH